MVPTTRRCFLAGVGGSELGYSEKVSKVVYEAEVSSRIVVIGFGLPTYLVAMQNSPIVGIASQMWLRPLYRLAVVQNVQGTVRSTTSARHAASENERTQKKYKPNMSSLLSDISHRRHHCYQTSG